MSMSEDIKAALPIEEAFRADGHELRKLGTQFVTLCPFHQEKTPSCYISPAKRRFHCFGCGEDGTVIDYQALTRKISPAEAIKELSARLHSSDAPCRATVARERKPIAKEPARRPMRLGDLECGTAAELTELSRSRKISIEALELATARGFLRFFTRRDHRAWVITDRTQRNAQARRCDGASWQHIGGKKAWTLPGYKAAWPIGVEEARGFECVALVEGGPDFLAAFHFLIAEGREEIVAPVAMLGSSNRIPEEALPIFSGKRLRIFPHVDGAEKGHAGLRAAARWEAQLRPFAASVDAFDFAALFQRTRAPIKDLNDATCLENDRDLASMMNF